MSVVQNRLAVAHLTKKHGLIHHPGRDQTGHRITVSSAPELTIVILCRNEEGSIAHCVGEAREFLDRNNIDGEILVVDNNSHDRSAGWARDAGARVVVEVRPGYGNAINAGIRAARGQLAILGDGDGEHDLGSLESY